MKRIVSIAVLFAALAGGAALAQQPSTPPSPEHRHDQHMQGGMCSMMGSGGMMGGGMMGGMMHGAMMPGGSMGMMGRESDPRMMQMRGEMMKAATHLGCASSSR